MPRKRWSIGLMAGAMVSLLLSTGVHAAPSPSSVTVGVGGAGPSSASVSGGPIVGQGDNAQGSPLPVCQAPSCESIAITLAAPGGFTAANQILLKATVADPNAPPTAPALGSFDTYLEDSSGHVVGSDVNSDNPSTASDSDAAPGSYALLVTGSTGANVSYTATITAIASARQGVVLPSLSNTISFGVPAVVDPIHAYGEPDINVDARGNVFASGPAGTGSMRSLWEGSVDGGNTFRVITAGPPASAVAGTETPPGGGDTDIAFDNHTPQGQYFADLYTLTCLRVATSADEGATVNQNPHGCTSVPGADRQWFAIYDPPAGVTSTSPYTGPRPLVYLEYNHYVTTPSGSPGAGQWIQSTDGLNYTPSSSTAHFGADGYPSIDQVTGDVFQANYNGSAIALNIGRPDAGGNLTFLDDASGGTSNLITVNSTHVDNNSGEAANFVVSSIDSARNLYVVWVGRSLIPSQRQVYVAAAPANNATPFDGCSTNCWNHWTPAVQVSDGSGTTGDAVNIFPWIKAGGPGMADAVWYGDASSLDPTSTAKGHVWNVFMDQVRFATDASGAITFAQPATALVKATPHPMDYLDVCLVGTLCVSQQGNRNLADFFNIAIDHSGAAEIVYNDTSNGLIQGNAPNSAADHPGAPLVTVIRQNGGLGLYGTPVTGPSASPTGGLTSPGNNALYPVLGGSNQPALDLLGSSLSLSGTTLTVTMKVADLTQLPAAAQATRGALQEYVTRWQMGSSIYYAEMSAAGSMATAQFAAGAAQTVDLCSVSACRPQVIVYPESGPGASAETGSATCPANPSPGSPCIITISVNAADVGGAGNGQLLEQVGAYSFSASHPQAGTTNGQAEADNVPLEVDGVCCYNFAAGSPANTPEAPMAPILLLSGAVAASGLLMRRRSVRRSAGA